ncbi:DUF2806 domain-containing protein [Pseudomonas sp. NPDC090233]|uniref:DUF2806 domain-containing protein n=1 Tax=Pseudomonas sp. NPDC090233 TaxID=3364479 RepID=UPI00383B0DEB
MTDGNSLINFGDISKPATVLIEKISSAVGIVFEPHRVKRMARAEAEADRIRALARFELSDIENRAIERFVAQEARKQENIESIATQAAEALPDNAEVSEIEEDWITHFFKHCDTVSDKQMQSLWARLLSSEATKPGTYSKRTVDFISTMNKSEAELFSNLCTFVWKIGEPAVIIKDLSHEAYNKKKINFINLKHLDSIGLISFEPASGYINKCSTSHIDVSYYDQKLRLGLKKDVTKISIGAALLTTVGKELFSLCRPEPDPDHLQYMIETWSKEGITVSKLSTREAE